MVDYIPNYGLPQVHEEMLSDNVRGEIFKKAIEKNIKEGDKVLDLGTGTGILALFAAKAGAYVYAVEPTRIIEVAKMLAKENNVDNKIEFINKKIEDVEIPKVDYIIGEWIGVFGVQENFIPLLADVRKKFLKQGGKLLPHKLKLYLAPIEDEEFHKKLTEKWKSVNGLSMKGFSKTLVNDVHFSHIKKEQLLSEPEMIKEIDTYSTESSEFSAKVDFEIKRNGYCHGLGGWFIAEFHGDIKLDTSPFSLPTHWEQAFFPIEKPLKVNKGDKIKINFNAKVDEKDNHLVHFSREVLKI